MRAMDYSTTTHCLEHSRTRTCHPSSGCEWHTDIPVALDGLGEKPCPADMLAATAAACMTSLMSLLARRKNVDACGMMIDAECLAEEGTITGMRFRIIMPPQLVPLRRLMENAAESCPVRKALSPTLKIDTEWVWEQDEEEEKES